MLYPQRGRTQLFQLIAAYIRDNALNQVTPADFRRVLKEIVSSDWNRADDGTNGGGGGGGSAQLADFITLDEAGRMVGAANPVNGAQPGVLYVIAGSVLKQWNGGSTSETVFVEGLVNAFAPTGWVDDGGVLKAADVDVLAGTWSLSASLGVDPYDLPTAKVLQVITDYQTAQGPFIETDTAYYDRAFIDDYTQPGDEFEYKCTPSRPASAGGATVWKWRRYLEAGV